MAKKDDAPAVAGAPSGVKRTRQAKPVDHETAAIAAVTAALSPLTQQARTRVMGYVNDRLSEGATTLGN
jgi:hypothetical protein